MSRAVWMSDGHRKLFFYGQEEEYIREVPIPNVIPWDTFLSIYPERNVQLYRNHPRRDLYQVWKWLSSRDKTAGDSCWNLAEIFQEEIRNLTGAERTTWKDSPKIDEAWKQLCAEWTRLGFSLDYSTHHPFVGTAACLWIYLSQDNHLSWEESSQLSRVTVLLRCSSDPKQVCKRQDVLSKLPSCALWLLAIMSLHHWEDIVEYYEFLVSYCKDRFRLDGICLLFQNETKEFLQTYLDGTGDVQSATLLSLRLLSTEICPRSWIAEYRRILEHHGQWDLLAQLDIFCGWKPHVKSFGDTTNSLEAICYFCNKSLLHTPFRTSKEGKSSIPDSFPSSWRISSFHHHPRKYERHTVEYCPWCKRELPKCCICLFHLSCWNPAYDPPVTLDKQCDAKYSPCTLDNNNYWFTWCIRCRHASHIHHILQWFDSARREETCVCPVSGCNCRCWME